MSNGKCADCGRGYVDFSPDTVAALVDQIPISPELKASAEVITHRLAICLACDALKEKVLCAHCGCFIRFRARARGQYCPHPAGEKWTRPVMGASLLTTPSLAPDNLSKSSFSDQTFVTRSII